MESRLSLAGLFSDTDHSIETKFILRAIAMVIGYHTTAQHKQTRVILFECEVGFVFLEIRLANAM
jgi:hypothetical protein